MSDLPTFVLSNRSAAADATDSDRARARAEQPHSVCYLQPAPANSGLSDDKALGCARYDSGGVDVQVRWDGSDGDPGACEFMAASGSWSPLPNIDPSDDNNDVFYTPGSSAGAPFLVRFQRGPEHSDVRFDVKAIPIVGLGDLRDQPSDYVAVRGRDYHYPDGTGPDDIAWTSATASQGPLTAVIALQSKRDYELWIRLRHPTIVDRWRIIDPIVRTGDAGGGANEG